MNIITVKTQNNFRIHEIVKVTYQNKVHKPAALSICGAWHLHSSPPSGAAAAVTIQHYLAYNIKNRPIKVLALYIAPTKMSYWQQAEHREYSKPFEASGGYGHCLWDPNLRQENVRRFCWWGKALKKQLSRRGLPPSVQYGLCHFEPMKASDPVFKKKKIWVDTMSSDSFHKCHFKEIVYPPQNGEQPLFLQSCWELTVKPPAAW